MDEDQEAAWRAEEAREQADWQVAFDYENEVLASMCGKTIADVELEILSLILRFTDGSAVQVWEQPKVRGFFVDRLP